jgi:hypothetical protein
MKDSNDHDLDFRPDYWDPSDPVTAILANVKGAKRREMIADILSGNAAELAGDNELLRQALSQVEPGLLQDELDDPGELNFLGPRWMGGEYLPAYLAGEVEIARITLESVTMDVVSIRARRAADRIRYRVVDEYESRFEFEPRDSELPLTFGELIEMIESIRDDRDAEDLNWVDAVKDYNLDGGGHLESMRDFVSADSPFYPQLAEHFRAREEEWYRRMRDTRFEHCRDCGDLYDTHFDHECPEREARIEREKEALRRRNLGREALEDPRVAPFLDELAQVVEHMWDIESRVGSGPGMYYRQARVHAVERYARMYAVRNGRMPRGIHSIEPPRLNDGRKTLEVNFDTLAEYARLRREGNNPI